MILGQLNRQIALFGQAIAIALQNGFKLLQAHQPLAIGDLAAGIESAGVRPQWRVINTVRVRIKGSLGSSDLFITSFIIRFIDSTCLENG